MRTVITHFYNEEYLLPRWLKHHKKYFDFGILIDYASTDNSVAICKEICPHWQIFPSGNADFDSSEADHEVMFYERQLTGWRIALTVTEFLVGDLDKMMHTNPERSQWFIPGIRFTKWDPTGSFDDRPLWEQQSIGVSYDTNPFAHQCRSLHNFNDIEYTPGRHFLPHNTTDALVLHYAHCIVGEPMMKRRLQIQHRMSMSDKEKGLGSHHFFDVNGLNAENLRIMHDQFISIGETDCSDYIRMVT